MREYRRRLPHRDVPGEPVFLTWRLHGSLPPERVFYREHLSSGKVFVAWDRLLDTAAAGPLYLRQPPLAKMMQEHLEASESAGLLCVHAYAIMPNHVHLLCTPLTELGNLMKQLKGPTARMANELLWLSGRPFWQEEYFDRMIRDGSEFDRVWEYIEWNPVKARLVERPEEFPWSSAAGFKSRAG